MNKLLILIPLLLLSLTEISAEDIPDGVVYKYATDEVNRKVEDRLIKIIKSRSSLEGLPENWNNKKNVLVVGNNLGNRIFSNNLKEPFKVFHPIEQTVPMKMATLKFASYGINHPVQLKMFSECFWKEIKIDPDFKIRKLTSDEMALIWFFIGWDLDEPIFVIEDKDHTLVFDFTSTGEQLDWIEDIRDMKYEINVRGKTIKAGPSVLGEGKEKHVLFMGDGGDTFFVIE